MYDGYRAPNSSYFVSGSGTPGLSVDLPSPDSGIGPDQVEFLLRFMCALWYQLYRLFKDKKFVYIINVEGKTNKYL